MDAISEVAEGLMKDLRAAGVMGSLTTEIRTSRVGINQYELQGVPVDHIGPKDLEKGSVEVARRDTLTKQFMQQDEAATAIPALLDEIQASLLKRRYHSAGKQSNG